MCLNTRNLSSIQEAFKKASNVVDTVVVNFVEAVFMRDFVIRQEKTCPY